MSQHDLMVRFLGVHGSAGELDHAQSIVYATATEHSTLTKYASGADILIYAMRVEATHAA